MTKPLMSIELLAMVKLLGMRDHINEESFWKMYKKLRRLFYQSTAWRKLATKVRRKQGKCMFCKKTVPLDVHHVVYLFNDPTRGLDMTNLVALCRKHHNEIHEGKLKVAA